MTTRIPTVDPRSARVLMWGTLALLLVAPAIATALTGEVRWGAEDFGAAALLLGGLGLAVELVLRLPLRTGQRIAAAGAALATVAVVWADAAVGVF